MSKSILITGGAASGKSRWAATSYSHYDYVLYMRTGEAVDPDTLHRIEYSNNQNGVDWDIVEGVYDDPAGRIGDHKFVIFDRLSDYASIMIDRMCPDISQMSDELMKSIERRIIADIEDMRERIPGLVLRTSLIVGLPGETEDEFAELCEFLQNVGIERVGVFEYSPEEGTEAAELPDQIDDETKQNRRLIVEELQSGVLDDYNTSRHGEVMQVLCEGFDEEQGLWYGRTYADSVEVDGHVYFDAADNEPAEGEFVSVLITESLGPDLLGVRQKEA